MNTICFDIASRSQTTRTRHHSTNNDTKLQPCARSCSSLSICVFWLQFIGVCAPASRALARRAACAMAPAAELPREAPLLSPPLRARGCRGYGAQCRHRARRGTEQRRQRRQHQRQYRARQRPCGHKRPWYYYSPSSVIAIGGAVISDLDSDSILFSIMSYTELALQDVVQDVACDLSDGFVAPYGASALTASDDGRPRSGFLPNGASVLTASDDGQPKSGALLNGASVLAALHNGRPRFGSLRSLIAVPSEERASEVSAGRAVETRSVPCQAWG